MALPGRAHDVKQDAPALATAWSAWGLPVLVAFALTPLALIAHSYKFVNDDQILYIPFLQHRLDPSLYPGDYFFNQPQASISFFEDLLIWPVRLFGLEWTMLAGYLLAQASILFCLHLLARRLVSHRAAYLAMALFILPISIGGTFVRTYDNYLNPRTLTLPLGLLTLLALRLQRPWPAAILVSLHLLLHPLSGLHTWLVMALLLAWWAWRGEVNIRALIGPMGLLLGVLALLALNTGGGGEGLWLDATWRAVLWRRTPYVFLASWRAADWASMGLYLLLGLVGWHSRQREPRTTHLGLAVLAVTLGTTLAVGLGVDGLGLAPLTQLQLARSWRLVLVLAVIFGADAAIALYERRGWGATLAAALLATTIYFDRADEEWQPVFAVLLVALVVARVVERRWGKRWAEGLLALAGASLALPAVLRTQPSAQAWPLTRLAAGWSLPDEALWPASLVFGLLLIASARKRVHLRPHPTGQWLELSLGCVLTLVALFPLAGTWLQRDWTDYLNDRLQMPFNQGSPSVSPSFRAWREVQLWAAAHTPPQARFVTDPDEKGFRVFSRRSPIVEEKDGAAAMFSRAYALEWDRRMQALAATGVVDPDKKTELIDFSVDGLVALHGQYPFDYVVGRQSQNLPWPEVYRNERYVVYAWPD